MYYSLITGRSIRRLKDVSVYKGMTVGMSNNIFTEWKLIIAN